jgi:hypothetical protein
VVELDSPVWEELHGGDLPSLIRLFARNPAEDTWASLSNALIDQGDVFAAAYAAVPHLLAILDRLPHSLQIEMWEVIAYIASRNPNHVSSLPCEVWKDYIDSVTKSKSTLFDAVRTSALNEHDTICLIQALAAVSGSIGPGRVLGDLLCRKKFGVQCPTCYRLLCVEIRGDRICLTTDEMMSGRTPKESWLAPPSVTQGESVLVVDDITPDRCEVWLPRMAEAGGHPALALKLKSLYQTATCPQCGGGFPLLDEIFNDATIDVDRVGFGGLKAYDDGPPEREAIGSQISANNAEAELFHKLDALAKPDIVRILVIAAEVELYECAFSAELLGNAELALSAARAWLESPSAANEEKARLAGSQALKVIAGAAATACGRMRELAAKTCVDALMGLSTDIRELVMARIRETKQGH